MYVILAVTPPFQTNPFMWQVHNFFPPNISPYPFCNSAKQCQKDGQCPSQHSYWLYNKPSKLAGSSGEALAMQASRKIWWLGSCVMVCLTWDWLGPEWWLSALTWTRIHNCYVLFISLNIVFCPAFFQAMLSVVARLAGWYGLDWVFIGITVSFHW